MSKGLRPIRARRRRSRSYSRLNAEAQWKPWKGWNWNSTKKRGFEMFGKKSFVILLIGLAITIGFGAAYADPNNGLFHSYSQPAANPACTIMSKGVNTLSCTDPTTAIWTANEGLPSNLNGFNLSPGQRQTWLSGANCGSTGDCIELDAFAGNNSVAITKDTIGDLGITSGKSLVAATSYHMTSSGFGTNIEWGFFITSNNTAPRHDIGTSSAYNPRDDPNVLMVVRVFCESGTCGGSGVSATYGTRVDMNKHPGTSETITSQDIGACGSSGSCIMALDASSQPSGCFTNPCTGLNVLNYLQVILNYTAATNANTSCSIVGGNVHSGAGCSWIDNYSAQYTTLNSAKSVGVTTIPQNPFTSGHFYLGFYSMLPGYPLQFEFFPGTTATLTGGISYTTGSTVSYFVNTPTGTSLGPQIDTGGFFGPVIRALISIGIWILNGVFGFIAFIVPALNAALSFLETGIVTLLNLIGGLVGYPTAGTDLQTEINAMLNFFGQAGSITANIAALWSRFVDANSAYFQWVTPFFATALSILTFVLNGIPFTLTIVTFAFKGVTGVYVILLLTMFLVFTGDDALGGIVEFFELFKWLTFGLTGWLARLANFIIDIITAIIGLIPKPFVQMVAHAMPRLPVIEVTTRFTWPRFDLAEIRNGNMFAVWCWFVDFTFLLWYNGVSPALPGSIGSLASVPASTLTALRGMLIIPEIGLIVASMLAFVIWPITKMLTAIGFDLGMFEMDLSAGSTPRTTGPLLGGVKISRGKKHLQGRLERKLAGRGKKDTGIVAGGSREPNLPSSGGMFAAAKQAQAKQSKPEETEA